MPSNNGNNKSEEERKRITQFMIYVSHDICTNSLGASSDPVEIEKRIDEYLAACERFCMPPNLASLSAALGVGTATLSRWAHGEIKCLAPRVMESIKKVYTMIEGYTITGLQTGAINPIGGAFTLNNNFGYANNTTNVNIEVKPQQSIDQLQNKYAGLLPECAPETENDG